MDTQYYSAIVLTNIVSSAKGVEFKDQAIPALVKLIATWHWFVQIQVTCLTYNSFHIIFWVSTYEYVMVYLEMSLMCVGSLCIVQYS